jgi:hypothetical protein
MILQKKNKLSCKRKAHAIAKKLINLLHTITLILITLKQQLTVKLKHRLRFSVETINWKATRTNTLLRVVVLVSDLNISLVGFPCLKLCMVFDLDVFDFMSFVNHSRTRNCNNPSQKLKVPSCKSSTFQSSFFNRIVPLWNHTCKIASPGDLCSLATFKSFLSRTYFNLLSSSFDVDMYVVFVSQLVHAIEIVNSDVNIYQLLVSGFVLS